MLSFAFFFSDLTMTQCYFKDSVHIEGFLYSKIKVLLETHRKTLCCLHLTIRGTSKGNSEAPLRDLHFVRAYLLNPHHSFISCA